MLKAIKKFFGIQKESDWIDDRHELAQVPAGTVIIDNNGITEGWPATEWMKRADGDWENRGQMAEPIIVSDSYFQMPFLIVDMLLVEPVKVG
jgi:hypothetical protein